MLAMLPQLKQTPTHIAASRGGVALVKVLAEHEKFAVAAHKDRHTHSARGRRRRGAQGRDRGRRAGRGRDARPGQQVAPEQ